MDKQMSPEAHEFGTLESDSSALLKVQKILYETRAELKDLYERVWTKELSLREMEIGRLRQALEEAQSFSNSIACGKYKALGCPKCFDAVVDADKSLHRVEFFLRVTAEKNRVLNA